MIQGILFAFAAAAIAFGLVRAKSRACALLYLALLPFLTLDPSAGGFEHTSPQSNNAHGTDLLALVSVGLPGLLRVLLIVGLPIVCSARRVLAGPLEDRPTWTFVLAIQCTLGASSITSFGVTGYANVAMLFHHALYAWTTQPLPQRVASPISGPAVKPALGIRIPAHPMSSTNGFAQ